MTRPLWTLDEIVAATSGHLDVPAGRDAGAARAQAVAVSGISIDTRTLEPGDLFVPLTDSRDGHAFVPQGFAKGAKAALVRQSYARQPGDGFLVRVPEADGKDPVLAALERIGIAARARLSDEARVLAVTGSAGKTGTKEMLRACLKVCASSPDKVHAPEKSFNNHWGVPLTLARMPADAEYAVFEIGMNHSEEIRPLTRMVRPHVAIVTNVLPVHVGNFPDGEIGVANAKAEIFEGLVDGGVAIVLRDSPHFELLKAAAARRAADVRTFGRHVDADVRLGPVSADQPNGARYVQATLRRQSSRVIGFELGMLGDHLAINAMAVVAALETLGCNFDRATAALSAVRSAAGRGARQIIAARDGDILLIDESYNANPASMAAALANLAECDLGGRRVAVMGDMLELGADAARYHNALENAAESADLVLCCGPNMRHLFDALPPEKRGHWAPTSDDLIACVLATIRPGDAVMVKGSLGSRMAPIVDAIKTHFADA